ncbi:aminotransferase class V-fold PLP-dependent enzyme [Actinokineospora sp. NBRC 105648]|uniref:pyridoxal phosphate-dependent decarboxylase family protein n=1 Tax=Actinokineospora sp. NBRC 105648 TaxID=3032206 RepID=UPI00249FF13B|nr:aminotransferase class V-fold PLP-dependent enzyme [Actinokineospora sp. NBRC 105648]GLZ38993.1 aspartate aminotransferase family protein [Actinokineospora sp. NBRC 105648]
MTASQVPRPVPLLSSDVALAGAEPVGKLVATALAAMAQGIVTRGGPLPAGGPDAVRAAIAAIEPLPTRGIGAEAAIAELSGVLAAGSADPADPWCAAHLHCPPLAVSAAADLVASVLNPSMDSWDQAPAASALEGAFTARLARLCYPRATAPDALITSGGTESNLTALLLAREALGPDVVAVCGRNSHHSIARAGWLLGLPEPVPVATVADRIDPAALAEVLRGLRRPAVVVATAGTTNTGAIDPLGAVADLAAESGSWLHVDAAYGGALLFSDQRRALLDGLDRADTIALDLHKLGWQPIAAGVLACREASTVDNLATRADYLNADDDTEAGLPDLLGRSLRTSRRPDAFKMAVTARALGVRGIGELVDRCCETAMQVARAVDGHPRLRLWAHPTLSTVLLRPSIADEVGGAEGDALVAAVRRGLLDEGTAVLGRATLAPVDGGGDRLWLKLTLLHPHATLADYLPLLDLVADRAARCC